MIHHAPHPAPQLISVPTARHSASPLIMVVDDEDPIREVLTWALLDEGYQVVDSDDGNHALKLVQQRPPALILLDLMMPKMPGCQVMQQLRSTPVGAAIPVLLLSAGHNLRATAEQYGATGWIGKPFDLDVLLETVQACLEQPHHACLLRNAMLV